ncbi:MAG: cupin domain-containing protein [Hyphomicrobium sp.]
MSTPRSYVWPLAAVLLSAALLIAGVDRGTAREAVASLLSTTQTVVGQPIVYPTEAPAKVAAAVVTMQPGEETGWHQHDVPMFGYILDGEVTVDYGAKGTHVYRRGDAIVEAVDVPHNGRNTGAGEARILSVFMGAEGVPNTQMLPAHPAAPAVAPQ